LLKAGTSIGALVREAEFAQSKADFISKLSIVSKNPMKQNIGYCFYENPDIYPKRWPWK